MQKEEKMSENGEKSILSGFFVREAPKSWSKYTTSSHRIHYYQMLFFHDFSSQLKTDVFNYSRLEKSSECNFYHFNKLANL